MTAPIQHAVALPTAAEPATTSTKTSTEWQQFCDWFSHPVTPGSGSTPPSTAQPATTTSSQPAPATVPPSPAAAQTAQQAPAESLWETSVTGSGPFGSTSVYNTTQFATAQTAQEMAQIVGGQEQDFSLGLYTTSSPIREIVGAGDNPLNAGLVANLFQKYGDQPGSYAWTVIDRDLGKTQS
jgi:hypothetical protein